MTEIFKLKINIGDANIELEGDSSLVHTIFTELRDKGLGQILHQPQHRNTFSNDKEGSDFVTQNIDDKTVSQEKTEDTAIINLPNIKDIVMKNLPKTELEWVLIYALYASNEGVKTFTMEDLRQMYRETNRFNDNRNKNFSTNFKKAVSSDWFAAVNDNDYIISDIGKNFSYEILQRTPSTNSKSKKVTQSHIKQSYQMIELNLNQKERGELKEYFDSFKKLNHMEKALVLASWLVKRKKIEDFNEHIIFSALKTVSHSTAFDIRAALNNGKNKSNYFKAGENSGYYEIHHLGDDRVAELEKDRG